MSELNLQFPDKLKFLFQETTEDGKHVRYKVAHGGRGSGKSWGFARALLIKGISKPKDTTFRVLCAREIQSSIKDSVHKLLKDQIYALGLENLYEIQRDSIIGHGEAEGTEFLFEGIRHNVQKIRSMEGIDVCWIEEGALVSKESLNVLIPTIRKTNSQIWITFNPDQETDEVYQRYVKNTPTNCLTVEMNYWDNPWFPAVLQEEMETCKAQNPDDYNWIWCGKPRKMLEGAVYMNELRAAEMQQRIRRVPYDPTLGVQVVVDLGWADMTALWFVQKSPFENRFIRYYEDQFKTWDHYLKLIQDQGYIIDTIWLPHDAKAKSLGTGKSIFELTLAKGFKARIVPRLSLRDGLNAARTIFPLSYFDENECSLGLYALRHYKYKQDAITKEWSRDPEHNQYSHGADAFRYAAIAVKAPKVSRQGTLSLRDESGLADLVDEEEELLGVKGLVARGMHSLGWMGR